MTFARMKRASSQRTSFVTLVRPSMTAAGIATLAICRWGLEKSGALSARTARLIERAEERGVENFHPAHMIDQSHNVTDPIESLISSANEIRRAYAQALLVDRAALDGYQDGNDALMASDALKRAYRTDVEPILAEARRRAGGAIDPIAAYRASGYRQKVGKIRPASTGGSGGII